MKSRLYYIVSLHQTTTELIAEVQPARLYYIVSLHQTTTFRSYSYISAALYYIVSLHQTTTSLFCSITLPSCIISFLYIKPQLDVSSIRSAFVVLYRFSTSNHNMAAKEAYALKVVLYRFSTSNHNLLWHH